MAEPEVDQKLRDLQKEYLDFLDDEEDDGIYHKRVKHMIEDKRFRLSVNINDLRKKNPSRAVNLLQNAFEEQVAFNRSLKEYVTNIDTTFALERDEFFVGFEGSFGSKHVTPRTLTSRFIGNLICIEGIVIKCSLVRPKVVKSVHFCPATNKTLERRYTDLTSLDAFPSSAVYPTKDEDGNLLETEYGLSTYKDHQTLTIQEMPEKAPAGQLPRSVDIILEYDLVDLCKPGDRVQIVGNYRCLPNKNNSFTSGMFRTVVLANSITQLSKETSCNISRDDVKNCRTLVKKYNMFDLLGRSLAPSIHGHEFIKKAILCMLLGGTEKVLPNGTRLRGDINILLIGDPSVAKSQLLRYVLCTAPRAVATTGRGSSGVGLTAAVTTDQETGERRLEAGAMVIADRGIVCIDEFDKMTDMDRTAIHEVMEQGRVTIAKAGIHARLNARCSVLAAANPVYGRYDQYKTPMENIGLQDSLLSRFDLLFVVLDLVDQDNDKMISDHVVRMHRYRNPNEQDGQVLPMGTNVDSLSTKNPDQASEAEEETPIWEKYDALLHGNIRSKSDKIFNMNFMRKFIHIAKVLKPVLTDEASSAISEEYSRLRSQDFSNSDIARTQPVTVRTLETLIRLSTAHAKSRLSRHVLIEDAQVAIELVQYSYFKKVLEKEKKKKRKRDGNGTDDDGESSESDDEVQSQPSLRSRRNRSPSVTQPTVSTGDDDPYDFQASPQKKKPRKTRQPTQQSMDITEPSCEEDTEPQVASLATPTTITSERFQIFKSNLVNVFRHERAQSLNITRVVEYVNSQVPDQPFEEGEVSAAIERLSDANHIMVTDGIVFLI